MVVETEAFLNRNKTQSNLNGNIKLYGLKVAILNKYKWEYKLRRISKKFNSLEDAYLKYGKAIGWNPDKHEEILALIKQGIESNYNFTTLDDFIVDNDWLNLEAMSKDGIINNSSMKLL